MDPHRVRNVANALAQRLIQIDPANSARYQQRSADFDARWTAAIARWEAKAAVLRGRKIVVHHRSWIYLEQWLGLVEVGALEPKPGVPPTSAHLSGLIEITRTQNVLGIVHAAYQDPKASRWLSERSDVAVINLPLTVGGDAQSKDLFGLFDATIDKLLGAVK
jgi:zinc/manganese transport system substrate-binding protein